MILISNRGDVNISFPANSKVLPGGEVHPYVDPAVASWKAVNLTAHLKNAVDIMDLVMVTDAIRRLNPALEIHLYMPYLPYARQDRVPRPGESLTIKPFCDIINLQRYNTVTVLDIHSDVGAALLDRLTHITLPQIVAKLGRHAWERVVLVAPDAGAVKKVEELARLVGVTRIAYGSKHRDVETGKIVGTSVDIPFEPTPRLTWLVVDDICDGGFTFIELAKALREKLQPFEADYMRVSGDNDYCSLELFVTHGLFTKGYALLTKHYDQIRTTNSWHPNASYNKRPDEVNDDKIYWHPVQGLLA
jgi:Phosphoribosylpyrophosphate synthetase